jgi:hypothetical protein
MGRPDYLTASSRTTRHAGAQRAAETVEVELQVILRAA